MINRASIKSLLKPSYFSRGEKYYNEDRVDTYHYDTAKDAVSGAVIGSGKIYTVKIFLKYTHKTLSTIRGKCSCPVGYNCKHVVALLLKHVESNEDVIKTQQQDFFNAPTDQWLYQLKTANSKEVKTSASKQDLLYVLDKKIYSSNQRFYIETFRATKNKFGSYINPKMHHESNSTAAYMQPIDLQTKTLLNNSSGALISMLPTIESANGKNIIESLISSDRFYWQDISHIKIIQGEAISSELYWHVNADMSQQIRCKAFAENAELLPTTPPYYVNTETGECGHLNCGLDDNTASILISSPPVHPKNIDHIASFIRENLPDLNIPLPVKPKLTRFDNIKPTPVLELLNQDDSTFYSDFNDPEGIAVLHFDYKGLLVDPTDETELLTFPKDDEFISVKRNFLYENKIIDELDDIGLIVDEYDFIDDDSDDFDGLVLEPIDKVDTWLNFMLEHKDDFIHQGWRIFISDDFVFQLDSVESWYADVESSGVDWFSFELGVKVDGEAVNLLPFMVNLLQSAKTSEDIHNLMSMPDDKLIILKQDNGKFLSIPFGKVRHIIQTLVDLYDPKSLNTKGQLELSRYQSSQLAELNAVNQHLEWSGGETVRKFGEKLNNFKGIEEVEPPKALQAELRDYQKEGLNWLQFLREYDLGGILADDMGLGKTVQALAHILIEKQEGRADCPILVVAPTSLMVNWSREAEKFAPELKLLVLQGQDRKAKFSKILEHDVVFTTYPLLSRDAEILLEHEWHMVILDEAQNIKNPKSKAAMTTRLFNCHHRLCLTGTPMENHLTELWSQFHFLMPGLLGDERKFKQLFRNPIEKKQDKDRQKNLRDRVAPFMLRRLKSEVAKELPPKTEILSQVKLESAQRDLYETIRVSMHSKIKKAIDQKGMARSHIIILDALLKLRQVCCHPQLLKLQSAKNIKQSAKLTQLMEMVPEMVEEGRKILLFSQFTSMLAIIEEELIAKNIDYVKLTGQTKNRATPIDEFQAGKVPVFLISLKAGGSGLNLTAADTVIHYDPWWNPAAENQATDRAYRIGQDKPVFVYKMITEGTVEEKILEMQAKKQALADALFSEEQQNSKISAEELKALFEPL